MAFKLGRKQPLVTRPTLHLGRYLTPPAGQEPQCSAIVNGSHIFTARHAVAPMPARAIADRWEHKAIELLHDPAGNDTVGDCTCAAMAKLSVAWSHNAGDMAYWPSMTPLAIGLYERATGYNPADPNTDQGAELTDILTFVQKNGVDTAGRGKGVQWVSVDATKPDEVAKAIDIFGGVYTGVNLSPDWLNNPVEGGVWDVGAPGNPMYGHCVAAFDFNEQGVIINSWGLFITVTWSAFARYWAANAGGEVFTIVSPEWISAATQTSPSGMNAAQLSADLADL